MLVLSRKRGERIQIGNNITVVVLEVHGNKVRLGFDGPSEVPIHREEIQQRITGETGRGFAKLPQQAVGRTQTVSS